MILIDSHPHHAWLLRAVDKRIREEMAKLQVEINEEKSRIVDWAKGESFSFLGFDFRRIRSRNRKWRTPYAPKLKKRTALLAKLKKSSDVTSVSRWDGWSSRSTRFCVGG